MSDFIENSYFHNSTTRLDYDEIIPDFKYTFNIRSGDLPSSDDEITIAIIKDRQQLEEATRLLQDRYHWRGFEGEHRIRRKARTITFEACSNGETVGVLTLNIDSDRKLALDDTFPEEVRRFRENAAGSICELTKFAVNYTGNTMPVIAALFHVILIYGIAFQNCSDLLIEVIPSHRRFYEKMLGFRCISEPRMNRKVGALTQLMAIRVAEIRRHIDAAVGNKGGEAAAGEKRLRMLYAHFFRPHEEYEIMFQMLGWKEHHMKQMAPVSAAMGIAPLENHPLLHSRGAA